MMIFDPKLLNLFDYFSSINKKAYQNEFLLANDVLAKNPSCGNMLDVYFSGHDLKKINLIFMAKKLFLYYLKNLSWIFLQFLKKILFVIFGQNYSLEKLNDNPIFIDTSILVNKVVGENHYEDPYFPGLTDVLKKLGKTYVYVPKFTEAHNLPKFVKTIRILKKEKIPVLTEYQLLNGMGWMKLLHFIALYPFYVIRLIVNLGDAYEDRLARFLLWDTLSRTSSISYARLVYGERLSNLLVSKIKCISWFENQSVDKCFYKGLRKNPDKVFVYGAQLFIWAPVLLNINVDEREIEFGIVPDKVLANGVYFLKAKGKVNAQVGPALRYQKIYQPLVKSFESNHYLVLLPYLENEVEKILRWIENNSYRLPVAIKFHPSTNVDKYKSRIKGNMFIVEGNLYDLFKKSKMVFGAATGSMVEAVGLGIPAICLVSGLESSFNYLPDFAKGVLWDSATNSSELAKLIDKFDYAIINESDKLNRMAAKIKEEIFCEPSVEKIIEAFDLRDGSNL